MAMSQFDPGQIVKLSFDETNSAQKVRNIAGALITEPYDNLSITYVTSGNGIGEIDSVTFKQGATTVAVLSLVYNVDNKLVTVTKS